jgi:hypothetical protein
MPPKMPGSPPPPKKRQSESEEKPSPTLNNPPPPPRKGENNKTKKKETPTSNSVPPGPPKRKDNAKKNTKNLTVETNPGDGAPPPPPKKKVSGSPRRRNSSPRKTGGSPRKKGGSPRKAPPPPPSKAIPEDEESDDSDEESDKLSNEDTVPYLDHIDTVAQEFFWLCNHKRYDDCLTPENFEAGTTIVNQHISLKRIRSEIIQDYKVDSTGTFNIKETLKWFHSGTHASKSLLSKCKEYCQKRACDAFFNLICSFEITTKYGTKKKRSDSDSDFASKKFTIEDLYKGFDELKIVKGDVEKMKNILKNIGKIDLIGEVETKDGKKDDQINTNSKHTLWLKNVNKRKIERCFRHISNGSQDKELTYNNFLRWFMQGDDEEINNIVVHYKLHEIVSEAALAYKHLCMNNEPVAYTKNLLERLINLGINDNKENVDEFYNKMIRELGYQSEEDFTKIELIHKDNFTYWIARHSGSSQLLINKSKDYVLILKKRAAEEDQKKMQKLQEDLEAKKQDDKNKKWLHRMAMVFTKSTWPKSLCGFLHLCNAIKAGLEWEDPMYKKQPEKIKKERVSQVRFILKKVFRQFQNEIDRIHKLVEESEYYENQEDDFWEWRLKGAASVLEEKIDRSNAASSTKIIIRNGIRCLAEYSQHLTRANKRVKNRRERDAERGREIAISRVKTKVVLERLKMQEEAEKTAREEEEKLKNAVPVEFYENVAKERLHAVTNKKLLDEIEEVESKLESRRISRVAEHFQGFGKTSDVLQDKRQYLKGLKMELEEQYVMKHKNMQQLVAVNSEKTRKRVSKNIIKERRKLSPLHVFRGKLSKEIDIGLAKLKKNSVHTEPRYLVHKF